MNCKNATNNLQIFGLRRFATNYRKYSNELTGIDGDCATLRWTEMQDEGCALCSNENLDLFSEVGE